MKISPKIQTIFDNIWNYFEQNDLTHGKDKPKIVKADMNYAHPIYPEIGIDEDGIDSGKYSETTPEIIVLEESTHYICKEDGDQEKSADFSNSFMTFIASQADCNDDHRKFIRSYQTSLFKKWLDKIQSQGQDK